MDLIDSATAATRRMPHQRMIREWRAGRAVPVSSDIIEYVSHAGAWWRRTSGASWDMIPDGPFALSLSAGQARIARACREAGVEESSRLRDPWTVARNRRRAGVLCGKPASFMPMHATEPRPYPPAVCRPST